MQIEIRLLIGLVASGLIGLLAYRRGSLTRSGALGAVIVGTTIFGFGGWAAGLTLIAFFVSSSALSHFKENNARKQRAAEMFEKGGQRDLWQALANGGAAATIAVLGFVVMPVFYPLLSSQGITHPLSALVEVLWNGSMVAFIGAIATVTADTWATELGVLSQSKPRSILSLRVVEPGTSGGISLLGIGAALAGAVFVSFIFITLRWKLAWFSPLYALPRTILFCGTLGGLFGSLFDSFLGATVQAMYYSETRQKETEKPYERDGTANRPLRGWHWMTNDWVNFISSVFGALASAGLAMLVL